MTRQEPKATAKEAKKTKKLSLKRMQIWKEAREETEVKKKTMKKISTANLKMRNVTMKRKRIMVSVNQLRVLVSAQSLFQPFRYHEEMRKSLESKKARFALALI